MEQKYIDLISLVDRVNEILERLVVLAHNKKRLVIQGNVKELDSLIREEGIAVSELEKWEGARFRAQQQLYPDKPGINAQEMLQLAAHDCPQLTTQLRTALSQLGVSLGSLKNLNQHNNVLLQQSLDHISFLEAAIVGDQPGTYSQKGQQAEGNRNRVNLLDRKI